VKKQELSEYGAHSDNPRVNKQRIVRMRGSFGQAKHEKAESCPNVGFIRTE